MMIPSIVVPTSVGSTLAPPGYDEATKNCAPPDYESATRHDEFKFVPNTPPTQEQQVGHTSSSDGHLHEAESSCSSSSSVVGNENSVEVSVASSPSRQQPECHELNENRV